MKMMERNAYTAFGETGFGETGRHRGWSTTTTAGVSDRSSIVCFVLVTACTNQLQLVASTQQCCSIKVQSAKYKNHVRITWQLITGLYH